MAQGYIVKLYYNTGYDTHNIPENPAKLEECQKREFPAIQVIQHKFLSEVDIRIGTGTANNGNIHRGIADVDYCAIGGGSDGFWDYYSVLSIKPLSLDSYKLILIKDFITTAGGITNLKFTSGIITRLSKRDNEYYNNSFLKDDMLGCAKPLRVIANIVAGATSVGNYELAESTIDLSQQLRAEVVSVTSGGQTYDDLVTYIPEAGYTEYKMQTGETPDPLTPRPSVDLSNINAAQLFSTSVSSIKNQIAKARSLGIESAILAQYRIPTDLVTINASGGQGEVVTQLVGYYKEVDSKLRIIPEDVDTTKVYTRIFSGEVSTFGMMSAGGDHLEFSPEEICGFGYDQAHPTNYENEVKVKRFVDPRPQGRPSFRFAHVFSEDVAGPTWEEGGSTLTLGPPAEYLWNTVRGAIWERIPIRFTTVSGLDLERLNFRQSMGIKNLQWEAGAIAKSYARRQLANQFNLMQDDFYEAATAMSGIPSASWETPHGAYDPKTRSYAAPSGYDIAQFATSLGVNAVQRVASSARSGMDWEMNKLNLSLQMNAANEDARYYNQIQKAMLEAERVKFGVSTSVYAPQVNFTDDVNLFRDATKNGVVVYRYIPTNSDLERLTKIIKMYGEKVYIEFNGTLIESANHHLYDRGYYFTYMEIQGAEINTAGEWYNGTASATNGPTGYRSKLSKEEREGIAAQLSAGVRIWKNANPKTYESGYTDYLNLQAAT